jgi:pyruvate formate lyase activating enzyme
MHFTAFHPDYRMNDIARTPHATLLKARAIAQQAGCRHVYLGNVHDRDASSTWCHACGELLVERDWYELGRWNVTLDAEGSGACGSCGAGIAGRFDAERGSFGRRRVPLRLL